MSQNSDTLQGVVKFFKSSDGYGFIWPKEDMGKPENLSRNEGGREEIFFHVSEVRGDVNGGGREIRLTNGDEVTFELGESDKGSMAMNIHRTKSAAEKNRSSIPATNVTIGVKKAHVAALVSVLEDLEQEPNASSFEPLEKEAIKALRANLEHHLDRMNAASEKQPPAEAAPHHEKHEKKGGKKGNHKEATA